MEGILGNVPEGVLSHGEHVKLIKVFQKEKQRKIKEIFQYELTKFAMGEGDKDLWVAKRNAESLGKYRSEVEAATQVKSAQIKTSLPSGLQQAYNNYMQQAQQNAAQNQAGIGGGLGQAIQKAGWYNKP